jgi:hypothetical protein
MPHTNGLPASTEGLIALVEQLRATIVTKDKQILKLNETINKLTQVNLDALPEIDPYDH